ncbi:divalent cation tolerance protein CutA [Bradyrhizobium prioriisuperbiae]|uniref:divalent cation tolerance protein CutA n=1 Tax=Bradyrhizobium prioriisuperbiae TaxID=2854389 RepID=UPI0028E8B39C|nr:divalent cation tolerance protein CutA [Bradyrhizobium prioritasuperba]
MERAVLVYTTFPSLVEAEAVGKVIVERKLAACVNILPRVVGQKLPSRRCESERELLTQKPHENHRF